MVWSRLGTVKASGEPSVTPPRVPERSSIRSASMRMRPPRPCPPWRRASSASTRARSSSSPDGIPSRIPTRALPCDSPAVTQRRALIAAEDTPRPRAGEARTGRVRSQALVEGHVVERHAQLARAEADLQLLLVLVDARDLHALL